MSAQDVKAKGADPKTKHRSERGDEFLSSCSLSTGRPGRDCILLVGWQVPTADAMQISVHERD